MSIQNLIYFKVTVCHCRVNNTYKNCLIDVRHYFKTKTNRVPEISQPVNRYVKVS